MANKKKNAPDQAPEAPNAQPAAAAPTKVVDFKGIMESMASESAKGLDPNHQVDLLNLAHDIYGRDPKAAERYNMQHETVEKINHVVAIGVAVAIAREVVYAKNEFACLMNKAELETVQEICSDIGITIDSKLLPAPDKKGDIQVPSSAIGVSKETREKIEEEEEIRNNEVETDPTKITSEEQLIASLNYILVTRSNAYQKVNDALNFYQAYRKIQASKAENKEEALKEINEKSRVTLLKEMAKLIGACPLVLNGIGRYMHSITTQSKSPIPAFCMFRNTTKNKTTGAFALSNQEVADYVRTLIEWTSDAKIAEEKARLESLKKNLEALKTDEKKNEAGIKDTESKIAICEKNLAHFDDVISYVLTPSLENLNNLIVGYGERDTVAVRTFKAIADSFYDDIDIKEMKQDGVRQNLKQYAGIITNLFRDPSARFDQYSESNLVELEPIAAAAPEEKPAEEPKKE